MRCAANTQKRKVHRRERLGTLAAATLRLCLYGRMGFYGSINGNPITNHEVKLLFRFDSTGGHDKKKRSEKARTQ